VWRTGGRDTAAKQGKKLDAATLAAIREALYGG